MNRKIGFDRVVKLKWAEDLAWRMQAGPIDEVELRAALKDVILITDLPQSETRRKTSTVMLRSFVRVSPAHATLRNDALKLLPKLTVTEAKALYWGLMLMAFPLFEDVAVIIGRLIEVQGEAPIKLVLRRAVEKWGQRGSLPSSINRVINTMGEWGLLAVDKKKRLLSPVSSVMLNKEVSLWLAKVVLTISETPLLHTEYMLKPPNCFPFALGITAQDLIGGPFCMQRLDGTTEYVGLRPSP